MKKPDRSPLKDLPLRLPAQSLEQERRSLFEDKIEPWLLLGLVFVLVAALDWWRYLAKLPLSPLITTAGAGIAIAIAAWRLIRLLPKLRALRLGIEGEKVVGQYLERLRASGYDVFHDVVAPNFNLDHVLIGPAGVFVVETKTWSKPSHGEARIWFDGDQLRAGSLLPDRDPVAQALAQAKWLENELQQSTGRELPVLPVVLFPGWFVQQSKTSLRRCWVLEPKALPAFLEQEPRRLAPEDVKLTSYHLSRSVRAGEREVAGR